MTIAEAIAPTNNEICCALGVAPTIYPVFKSWLVAPPFAAAMHTIPPTTSAIGSYILPVQPIAMKTRQVPISVAIVIPEIGFELDPMMPTMRLATVTKKNPNTIIRTPSKSLLKILSPGICGMNAINTTSRRLPPRTTVNGKSRSVRRTATPALLSFIEATLSLNDEMIVGRVLRRVMKPPAATAPAPIWRTYAR